VSAVPPDESENPAIVEREIERTRRHMSRSIDAIEEKLEPTRLLSDAFNNFKRSVLGEEGSRQVIETIRANPVAAALTVIGIGWLALGARAPNATSKVGTAVGNAYDRVRNRASETYERGRTSASQASSYSLEQAGRAGHYVTEHPLAFGVAAVALGAVVGALLPTTRLEEEYAGGLVDEAMQKAGESGREFVQKAQEVASNVGRAAADSVKEAFDPAAAERKTAI
jgi:ElaB/YqjD/DUF883 family membrane-anchored ribosome-binding protein